MAAETTSTGSSTTTPAAPATPPPGSTGVKFKLNGDEIEVPRGTTIIQAAHARGVDVPYFCYHPGLAPEGNCRMCLVEASNSRKPVPACTTLCEPGIEVKTHSPAAKTARADVLEFLLINHPLDCPICDKSGECLLQDNSYAHGKSASRMVEVKETKHTKDLGKDIYIWGNRCIACTRCVRFCHEVAGTGELTIVERGDRSVIDVFPDYPLQNDLSGNVVDICPVGALIAKDFLYQARVWFEKKTPSICHSCAKGCNIEVQTLHNKVKRIVPRHNPHVNDYWMCDHGRFDYHHVLDASRWTISRFDGGPQPAGAGGAGRSIHEGLAAAVAAHGPAAVAFVASAWQTLESLFLLRRLGEAHGAPPESFAARARPDGPEQRYKKFTIEADKNPNRAGVARIFGPDAFERAGALRERIRRGEVKALVIVIDQPAHPLESEWVEVLGGLDYAAVFLLQADARLPASCALIPATAYTEREGCLLNSQGRLQLVQRATQPPRGIVDEIEVLQEALRLAGKRNAALPAAAVFRELAELIPEIAGKSYREISSSGGLALAGGGSS